MSEYEVRAELEHVNEFIKQNPREASAYLRRGNIHSDLGAGDAALADYSTAISLNPSNSDGYFHRAILYHRAGRWKDAVSDWSAVLERDPTDAEAHNNRGVAFEQLKNWPKALHDYDEALQHQPHLIVPRLARGNTFMAMGDIECAIGAYKDAIAHSPRTALLYVRRAEVYLIKGDQEAALADLNEARRLGYRTAELEVARGRVYHRLGQPKKAVSALLEGIRVDPSNAFAHGLCGHSLMKLGQFEAARSCLEKSIELDPLSNAANYSMGVLLQAVGDETRAREHFAKADAVSASPPPPIESISAPGASESVAVLDRTPEEIRNDRAKYQPPFSRFVGLGRRISSDLSSLQLVAMALAFPVFTGRATIDRRGASPPKEMQSLPSEISFGGKIARKLQQQRFVNRRYSGDMHAELSRSRYLSLAGIRSATPSYTLLAEMNAYAVSLKSGYCAAVLDSDGESINVVFRGLPGEPNPLHRLIADPDRYSSLFVDSPNDPRDLITRKMRDEVSAETDFVLPLPYEDVEIRLESAFDLRLYETRLWMIDFFRNPPPVNTDEDLAHGAWLLDVARAYEFDLADVHDWRTLLPVTNAQTFGGNAMTDLFATFLRKLGCDGLIFPSARCDHGVVIDEGAPVYDWGWNLVDYRGAGIPERLSLEKAKPLEPLVGIRHFVELTDGIHAGSFAHLGNTAYSCATNQQLYHEFCAIHGPEWRAKHGESEMLVRGYSWFRRTYSLERDCYAFVICDQCESRCSVDRSFLPRCPECGFSGDMGVFVQVPELLLPHLQPI